jgi:LuxR family transcriptional regulator, maltose regulon positive regulatory protein
MFRSSGQASTGVVEALRATVRGSQLLHPLDPAPSFNGWTVLERLLKELAALDKPLWLVISDMHELCSEEALRQLELLLLRAPKALRFVVSTRRDLRLGADHPFGRRLYGWMIPRFSAIIAA